MNAKGIVAWDPDIVAATQIDFTYSFKANYTTFDDYSETYTIEEIRVYEFIGTRTCYRVTDLDAAVGDDEWRLVTGFTDVGTTGAPPFFRSTAVGTDADDPWGIAETGMQWTGTLTHTLSYNYSGPGAPANTVDTYSSTETLAASFIRNGTSLEWGVAVIGIALFEVTDSFTVDIHTLKKSGSDDFGFTKTDTTADPGEYPPAGPPTTAWDWENSVTVTCS